MAASQLLFHGLPCSLCWAAQLQHGMGPTGHPSSQCHSPELSMIHTAITGSGGPTVLVKLPPEVPPLVSLGGSW
jgi:hypothetical protein